MKADKETERKGKETYPKKPSSPPARRFKKHSKEEHELDDSKELRGIVWRRLLKYKDPEQIDGLQTSELMSRLEAHEDGNPD